MNELKLTGHDVMLQQGTDGYHYIQSKKVEDKENFTIFITAEASNPGENPFDINIWDQSGNERVEDLEIRHIATYDEALTALSGIVSENSEINFIRLSDKDYRGYQAA